MMKISFCSIAFRNEPLSIEEIIPKVARLGFDGIEIWGNHLKGTSQIFRIKEILGSYSLPVSMVSPYFDFTDSFQRWGESLETARQFIDFASILECSLIRAFTGVVGSNEATSQQWKACVEGLKRITDIAAKKGIGIALETHPSTLVDRIESTLELLVKVDAPNLKINLDIYHLWEVQSDVVSVLDVLYPYVAHVHAKNANLPRELRANQLHPFLHDKQARQEFKGIVSISQGKMDYQPFLKSLVARGFSGFVSVEWFGSNILEVARQELNYLRQFEPNSPIN